MSTVTPPAGEPVARRPRLTPVQLIGVGTVTVVGAVLAAMFTDGAPANWPVVDAAYRAALVAACALAGSRARRWTLVWAAAAVSAAGGLPVQAATIAAAVAAVAMLVLRFRNRVLGAMIGAVAGLGALTLERPTATGATALVAAAALIPMLLSGYDMAISSTRRTVRFVAAAAVLFGVLGVAAGAVFAVQNRAEVTAAVEQSRAAVDRAADDPTSAQADFDAAAARFAEIGESLDVWWLAPARALPVVGANLEVARTASATGTELNLVAGALATSIDTEGLRSPQGGIDLAVLESLRPDVARAADQVDSSLEQLEAADSPWLVGPVRSGLDELVTELDGAGETARTAELAVERVPDILGADGERRYLMLLGNPAETRDLGGHIGNWAELTAVDGRLDLVKVGSPYEIASPATSPPLSMTPGAYPQSLVEMRPQYFPQNWGATADFPTVARLAAELYPQARPGAPLAGVIYADPAAFAALLNFTGPEPVPGTEIVLTPDNAEAFLTTGQYETFELETEGNAAVSDLIDGVVRRFGTTQLPRPNDLADTLAPLVRGGSLQFFSFDGDDAELLDRLGLTGEVERPGSGDLLAVLTRNTNPSKIDAYLRRRTEYVVDWDPRTGSVVARLRVTLENTAPTTGLPSVVANPIPGVDDGTNRLTLSVLSPWTSDGATLDGSPLNVGTQQELRGVLRHSALIDVPAGTTRVVEFDLSGNVGAEVPYLLQLVGQPGSANEGTSVTVRSSGPERSGRDRLSAARSDGAEDVLLRFAVPT